MLKFLIILILNISLSSLASDPAAAASVKSSGARIFFKSLSKKYPESLTRKEQRIRLNLLTTGNILGLDLSAHDTDLLALSQTILNQAADTIKNNEFSDTLTRHQICMLYSQIGSPVDSRTIGGPIDTELQALSNELEQSILMYSKESRYICRPRKETIFDWISDQQTKRHVRPSLSPIRLKR